MSRFIFHIAFIGALASNLTYMVSSLETCDINPDTVTEIDFENSALVTNTLNQDNGEMRFEGISEGITSSDRIDLVIKKTEGKPYDPKNADQNGLTNSSYYGVINIRAKDGEGTFDICFESNGTPKVLDAFFFSILDLDGTANENGYESTTIAQGNYSKVYLSESTEINQTESVGYDIFTATTPGNSTDNPENPNSLTQQQRDRTKTFLIENSSCFQLKLSVECTSLNCNGGRNFLLHGKIEQIVPPCVASSAPSSVASSAPTSAPGGAYCDPHFSMWTGEKFDFHGACDLVLLENPTFSNDLGISIHIRTTFTRLWSYISSAVIQIGNETFEVMGEGKRHWTNKIEDNDVGHGVSGYPITKRLINNHSMEFVVSLGDNMFIELVTFHGFVKVNIVAAKAEAFKESTGLMGNWNGKKMARDNVTIIDDNNEFGLEWQVLVSEPRLFHNTEGIQAPQPCAVKHNYDLRRRLGESIYSYEFAEAACSRASEKDRDACIFDVMATNDKNIAGAY